jgi:hypothetical protein
MIKKKQSKKHSKKHVPTNRSDKEPEYNVQILDPSALRRDILESLREIIIFMQGYETFRKIQEEKVSTFNHLKNDIKELTTIIDHKLRKFFPKGKLKDLPVKAEVEDITYEDETPSLPHSPQEEHSELDQLESQLKQIEGQLQGIK